MLTYIKVVSVFLTLHTYLKLTLLHVQCVKCGYVTLAPQKVIFQRVEEMIGVLFESLKMN